jgi:hypothetical protein
MQLLLHHAELRSALPVNSYRPGMLVSLTSHHSTQIASPLTPEAGKRCGFLRLRTGRVDAAAVLASARGVPGTGFRIS